MQKHTSPWKVLISLVCIYGGFSGILGNTMGIFFSAIRSDLGFRAGDLSLYYMIRSFTSAAAISWTTQRFLIKSHARKVIILDEIAGCLSFALMGSFHSLWQWYISALFAGVALSTYFVAIPIVLNNWFVRRRGLFLGIAMSASGILAAILSPLISDLITSIGWRSAVWIIGLACLAAMLVPTLLWFHFSPQETGDVPYGAGNLEHDGKKATASTPEVLHYNNPKSLLILTIIAVMLPEMLLTFAAQLPTFATGIGYTLAAASLLNSFLMFGNIGGKLIAGVAIDVIGVYPTGITFIAVIGLSMVLFLIGQSSYFLMIGASVCYGFIYAVSVNIQPMLLMDLYGPDDYQMTMSRVKRVTYIVGAIASAGFPYIYDLTGSFNPIFLFGILGCAVSIALFMRLYHFSRLRRRQSVVRPI